MPLPRKSQPFLFVLWKIIKDKKVGSVNHLSTLSRFVYNIYDDTIGLQIFGNVDIY
nr:MAG TPA: hypothetical protein [Caudoviricetes sp.]